MHSPTSRRLAAAFAALSFPAAAAAQATPPHPARAVADSAAAALLADSVVGLVIGAYRAGTPLFVQAYGYANLEARRRLSADDLLPIGSITKQFTAAGVLALVDDGRVSLDEPAATYLPALRERFGTATVRQLLNQTSGLGRYEMRFIARAPESADAVLDAAIAAPAEFSPGERFAYNNANYLLLGRIIEAVSGTSYETWLHSRFLDPLEMRHTRLCAETAADGDVVGYLVGTRRPIARQPVSPLVTAGAGALCSTAADLARWSHALHGGRVLSPASHREMITPPGGTRPGPEYAMGTVVSQLGEHRELWHNGALTSGFYAMLAHYPESSLTVVVLANSFPVRAEPVARAVARAVLDPAAGR